MVTRPFDFSNAAGDRLSGRLEIPDGPVRAWALFAHCFTCGKNNLAAVRISRRLAAAGIGVLRFDFTGLGGSEGDFVTSTFSMNVQDIVAAAGAMTAAAMPPLLLVGHSLGGAAVLAAAGSLPNVRAVVTIAAPFEVDHVLMQLDPDSLSKIERDGRATVVLGDRPVDIGRQLVQDVRQQDQGARIASLRRPLLILHSPTDEVVGIDNVTGIYVAARHPKSFVSLDGSDHLLTDVRDAEFAADMIACWSARYLPEAVDNVVRHHDAEAEETGVGKFQLAMRVGGAKFLADEPETLGGLGTGPTPFNLLSAALAACTTMTLRLQADRNNWPVTQIRTAVNHRKDKGAEIPDVFTRRIEIEGEIDTRQREALLDAANRCPVHRTLETGSRFAPPVEGWDTPPSTDRD
jgi:putative redox protein